MGPETGCSAHSNEPRSPFSNHSIGGSGTVLHSPWKNTHTHTHLECVIRIKDYMQIVARKTD